MKQASRLHRLAVAAALLCSSTWAWSQGRGTVELLPLAIGLGDAMSAGATGINDRGQVVGNLRDAGGTEHGFIWNTGDAALTLLTPGVPGSAAYAINNGSRVVGRMVSSGTTLSPMSWTANEGAALLPGTASGEAGAARAISQSGRIAGALLGTAQVWQSAYSSPLAVEDSIGLTGINDAGTLVGWRGSQPWVSDAFGAMSLALSGRAQAVNNRGAVVGVTDAGSSFVWSRDAGLTVIPGGPGSCCVAANAINDAGQVAGQFFASGQFRAFVWSAQGGLADIGTRYDLSPTLWLESANGINNRAQVVGRAVDSSNPAAQRFLPYRLTLHPDWQGGSGRWDSATNWNWGGTGVADVRVADVHEAVIDPGRSLTVWGGSDAQARSLRVGGTSGHLVSFDLNFGSTAVQQQVTIGTGGVLRGSGLLSAGTGLEITAGGRVQVDAGQHMLIATPVFNNFGQLRVQGTPLQAAQLEVAGTFFNLFSARTLVQHGRLSVSNGSLIAGQLALESGDLSVGDDTVVSGRLLVSFGRSSVSGGLINVGEVVVSNGAEASFYGALQNDGELRISSGGAANFFGPVSGLGSFTGSGEARFEGGLTIGASPGVATINFNVTLNSTVLAEIGGTTPGVGDGHHDKIIFNGSVRLLDAPLEVVWWGGFNGALGDRYDLFDWNGSLSGSFSSLRLPTLADGLVWDTSDLYGGGTLAIAAVPEPEQWALMLAGVALLLGQRRRGGRSR